MTARILHWFALGVATGLVIAPIHAAHSAPQALALLETTGPTPLVCADGVCKAEFTTYCLQKDRNLPESRTPYEVAGGGALHLILTGPNGGVRRVPAGPHVRIKAARATHTAVIIEIPERALAVLGARQAAIEVDERVTLMPVAVAGDDNPQSEQERRLAAGPLRTLGAQVIDRADGPVETVRALNRLVNVLPEAIEIDPGARKRLWRRALDVGFAAAQPAQIERAAEAYAACWRSRVVDLGGVSVRDCLRWRHDGLMWRQTRQYWEAVGTGS